MSTSELYIATAAAVRALGADPTSVKARIKMELELAGHSPSVESLAELLSDLSDNDPVLNALGRKLHDWDVAEAAWANGTERSTQERRQVVVKALGFTEEEAVVLRRRRPIFVDGTLVITAPWERWYTPERAAQRNFYWQHYENYLLNIKKWPSSSVTSLDNATSLVVERLTDPNRPERYQSKGLVVGYVQSGKTANFTGVTAKAIDAGYRLVIIMTGTLELLRAQTQRRVDMEMIGKQNIVGDLAENEREDYLDDAGWDQFLDLGSYELDTEIVRLTTHRKDYTSQFKNLKIPRPTKGKTLFHPDNLFSTAARVAIVKKNSAVLKKLVRDIKANQNAFAEIPVLIIDDESDQASVNTVDPEKMRKAQMDGVEIKTRRAINEQIALMLEHMPRAQYVGYTATPFANVFVDPSDEQGIFPRDFVIGLDRPDGYMGVDDFYDFEDHGKPLSNKDAHVRLLQAEDDDLESQNAELSNAVDDFVLAGGIKLWRQAQNSQLRFRHHTMLVHESVRKDDHALLAERVRQVWKQAGFTKSTAVARLKKRYEAEILPVSKTRTEHEVPIPPAFEDLAPYVARSITKITEFGGDPVIVVNSDSDINKNQQSLDFDRNDVWRILVGGTKLSRGFTVEGLTVTYFRRATNMSDSLTQMGRWFGFRHGYRDLVRLYIAEASRFGKNTVDLYEAFEGIARDEAAFRDQLKKYARWDGDRPQVTPAQIPPLVQQHLPWLKPTANNKMFNAYLVREVRQPFTPAGLGEGAKVNEANLDLWIPLLQAADQPLELPGSLNATGEIGSSYRAYVGSVSAERFMATVASLTYSTPRDEITNDPVFVFYNELIESHLLKNMLLVIPQPRTEEVEIAGVGRRALTRRKRRRHQRFGEITDPKHRSAVEFFASGNPPEQLIDYHSEETGVALVYLINETNERILDAKSQIVIGYSSYVPSLALRDVSEAPRFAVRRADRPDAVTVDAEE